MIRRVYYRECLRQRTCPPDTRCFETSTISRVSSSDFYRTTDICITGSERMEIRNRESDNLQHSKHTIVLKSYRSSIAIKETERLRQSIIEGTTRTTRRSTKWICIMEERREETIFMSNESITPLNGTCLDRNSLGTRMWSRESVSWDIAGSTIETLYFV